MEGIIARLVVYLRHGCNSVSVAPDILPHQWLAIAAGYFGTDSAFGESVVKGMKFPPRYQKATRQSDNETALYSKDQKLSKS